MAKPGHDVVSVHDLLGGAQKFVVPKYQRGYSWDEVNFKELWEDIRDTALKGQDLFLGGIILSTNYSVDGKLDSYEIIDGQQRLITFTILLRAMYDVLEKEKDQERFRRDIYRLIGNDEGTEFKLTLGTEDEEFFQKFIKKKLRDSHRRGLKKSHKMIRVCYELFRGAIEAEMFSGKYPSKIDFVDRLFECLKQKTQLLEITVKDEFDAYAIFESINAKRVDLTPAELIKNYFFSSVSRSEEELNIVQEAWDEILEELSPQPNKEIAITTYLRHFWIAVEDNVREKELYRVIKEKYKNKPSGIPSVVARLAKHSKDYAAIVYPEVLNVASNEIDVRPVEAINRVNFKQTYPLLLAALMKKLKQEEFSSIVSALEAAIIRRSIRGSNPNELEELLSSCARLLYRNGASAVSEVVQKIQKAAPSNTSVMTDLVNSSYTPNSKIILEEYEKQFSTGEKTAKNPTLEHIMPRTPGKQTDWPVSIEEHEHWLNNIGNLTLLGRPLNSSASNAKFSDKKSIYERSEYRITRFVAANNQTWNVGTIKKRAEEIAKFTVERWKLR